MGNINRRTFFKLVGTAGLTAFLGSSLYGCSNKKDDGLTEIEEKKYYGIGEHHLYIEISTETNGEAEYHEDNVTQTSGFVAKPSLIQARGGSRGGRIHTNPLRNNNYNNNRNNYSNNNSSSNNSSNNRYYGRSDGSVSNNFTMGLLWGSIIIGSTTLFYGNTEADDGETMILDIPEGYEVTNTEELKNEDTVYGYKVYMENTAPVEVTGYSDKNGNITYPYPGGIAEAKMETTSYVKKLDKGTLLV